MGIQSIATVSKVSVKAGDSIDIPCLYNLEYKDNVKYLCKGKWWGTCTYVAQTNQPDNSKPFSISDDQTQSIFTVTIHNPQDDGTSYWCAIVKNHFDVKQRFELSVTTGMPSLHVDEQEITAFEGGSVTVKFHDENPKVTKWCRLVSSSSSIKCMSDQIGSIDGATVTINTSVSNVFTVTMSGLKTENSGWYWCDKGDLQMPVNITVTELTSTTSTTQTTSTTPTTSTTSTTISTSTATTLQTATQNASLFTSAEPPTVQPSFSTVIGTDGESLHDKNKSSTLVCILSTTLVLLLLVVPTAFFGWRMKKKRNKTKTEVPVITGSAEVERDPDVHYATIFHNPDTASQLKNNIPEETVTYSTIVLNRSV
ncbi:CMRF35-like molecule 8 isoform X2 [Pseudochaenichthys georgianus]|uniref:CMRF35-like molecule 8 isoform X2 n=1 Tax=Pseudochaenichthys georgianus TaxID=52239 RepID=UPI00146AA0B9|nr:CMRF35-like molecule 8 isoform X2 [Pseudochaenichthys georgianus]